MDKPKSSFLSPGSKSLRALKRTAGIAAFTTPIIWFVVYATILPITYNFFWNLLWAVIAALISTLITAVVFYILFIILVLLSMLSIAILCYTEWISEDRWEKIYDVLSNLQPIDDLK